MLTANITPPSKILILGNHSCSNRGDAAILRGLIELLSESYPQAKITATTRYLKAAQYIIDNVNFIEDTLFESKFSGNRLVRALKSRSFNTFGLKRLVEHKKNLCETEEHHLFSQEVNDYDLVIQVGGSFFVDLYGSKQYEAPFIVKSQHLPYIMIGHSIGPFQTRHSKKLASLCFNNTPLLLRESLSAEHLTDLGCNNLLVSQSSDTAWLVSNQPKELPVELVEFTKKPTIALTLRELRPFDTRLGISQETFERAIGQLCNYIETLGYQLLFASTCTGLDSYHKDDRMIALRVKQQLNKPNNALVVMNELNDVELGTLLGYCQLTIGTRLHSAIISKNFGTPAFAIAYEHKSVGILTQMGLASFSINIHDIASEQTRDRITAVLSDLKTVNKDVSIKVSQEKILAKESILSALTQLISNEK